VLPRFHHLNWSKLCACPGPIRATGVVVNHGGVHADFRSKDIRADQDSAEDDDLG
jgi:hypothetical protein